MTALAKKVWRNPIYFIAFGFGSGLSPIAPGTCGTLAAIPVYWMVSMLSWPLYLGLTVFAFIVGVKVSDIVSRDLGEHDYKGIVWDEIVGYLLTMFLLPKSLFWALAGFVLFRLFDIWKPWPISWVDQRVKGGFGIMIDDVLAAIPAWILLQVMVFL